VSPLFLIFQEKEKNCLIGMEDECKGNAMNENASVAISFGFIDFVKMGIILELQGFHS